MLLSAKYVFPITSEPIVDGAVLVRGNSIVDIGEFEALAHRYPEEEVTNFGQAALLPGFVDLFTRLEQAALRGMVADQPYAKWLLSIIEKNSQLELSDWKDSAMLGGFDALSSGITTVADITSTGAALHAVKELGMRGVIYREVGAMDKMRVEYAMHSAERDIKKWMDENDSDRITIGISPASIYANHPQVFGLASEFATKEGLPYAMRLAGSSEEYNFVKYGSSMFAVDNMDVGTRGYVEIPPWLPFGVSPVRYALNWGAFDSPNVLLVHAVYVDDEDIQKLVSRDVAICTCPRSNAQLGMGVAPLLEFLQAGLRVGLGTDSPAATESTDMLMEMRTGLLLHRANNPRHFLDASKMLELATMGGARALRMDDKIGSLEIGKLADIIAVDFSGVTQTPEINPVSALVNTCTTSDVLMTMIDGEMLYHDGHLTTKTEMAKSIGEVLRLRVKLRS